MDEEVRKAFSLRMHEGNHEGEQQSGWEYWATKQLCQIKANPYHWEKDLVKPQIVTPTLLKESSVNSSPSAHPFQFFVELVGLPCTFS